EHGQPIQDGGHAFLVVYPRGAEGPVWWDPQHAQTWNEPPSHYVARTLAVWSISADGHAAHSHGLTGEAYDGGRGAGLDHAAGRYAEPDRPVSLRVRLGGQGEAAVETP